MIGLKFEVSDKDLDFVVNTAVPQAQDKQKLKRYIREDEAFREGLIGSPRVLERVMGSEEILLKISPRLLFEILLRGTKKELEKRTWVLERIGTQKIPVFGLDKIVELLGQKEILDYLANMLSSFTKIESFTLLVRVRKDVWRKIRFNDMDIDSLIRFSEIVDEENKFTFYKRIADVCLFITGVFPEYVMFDYRFSSTSQVSTKVSRRFRKSAEEYETQGKKFYRLASEHEMAKVTNLVEVLEKLSENFNLVKRSLDFLTQQYLHLTKYKFFNVES